MAGTKTDWVRIGRSGETIDGRVIEAQWLTQAADNYDRSFFSAPVWPGHSTWYRLGTVHDLKAEANDEGGVDLYAIIEPNEYYRQAVKAGQRLHTSMELRPNFRNSGTWYLQGLAATDEPASVATAEMQFSQQGEHAGSLFTGFVENQQHSFNEDQPPGWFTKFFKKTDEDEADMADKKELELLKAANAELLQKIEQLSAGADDGDDNKGADDNAVEFATAKDFNELKDSVKELSDLMAGSSQADALKKLSEEIKAQGEKLEAALKEENGSESGENLGDGVKASDYQ